MRDANRTVGIEERFDRSAGCLDAGIIRVEKEHDVFGIAIEQMRMLWGQCRAKRRYGERYSPLMSDNNIHIPFKDDRFFLGSK